MTIKLRLSDFEDDVFERRFEIKPEDIGLNDEADPMRVRGPIVAEVKARITGEDDVLVQAKIKSHITQECVSCLDEIESDRVDNLAMLFSPESKRPGGDAPSGEAESPDLAYYKGDEIELDEEIAGFILQEVEEYPRCRRDCKGLDPETGENLNHASPETLKKAAKKQKAKAVPEWKRKLMELGGGDE